MPPDYSKYRLGAVPSTPDHRDYRVALAPRTAPIPAYTMYGPFQPVQDQGQEGSCVGHAVAGALSYYELKQGFTSRVPSRRDAYEGARLVQPMAGEGASLRAALQYAQQTGLCLEPDWPYVPEVPGTPDANAAVDRPLNKYGAYAAVDTTTDAMRSALAFQGAPLVVAIPVFNGFYAPDANGFVSNAGALQGYHAVVVIGYDDTKGAFRIRNSWGLAWGDAGHCWYPYSLAFMEAWTFKAVLSAPPPPQPKPWWQLWWPW